MTPILVIAILEPVWSGKRETTHRVRQPISAICCWSVGWSHRTDDPAGTVIDAALPQHRVERRDTPAPPYEEEADCITKLRTSKHASRSLRLTLEFLPLTAAGSAEVRKAISDEIVLDRATRTVRRRAHEGESRAKGADVGQGACRAERCCGALGQFRLVFPGTRLDDRLVRACTRSCCANWD